MESPQQALGPVSAQWNDYVGTAAADEALAVHTKPSLYQLANLDRDRWAIVAVDLDVDLGENSTVEGTITHPQPKSCWVFFDPPLADDGAPEALRAAFARYRGLSPVWRTTSERETAAHLAAAAVSARADRVVVIGDQATIRAVASALANTGVALGIVPVGFGCNLARAIGAPTGHDDAIAVALGESISVVDLMKVTINGGHPTSSFITVGVEDGAIRHSSTHRTELPRSLRTCPAPHSSFGATATIDQRRPTFSRSAVCVIGIGSRVVSTGQRPATSMSRCSEPDVDSELKWAAPTPHPSQAASHRKRGETASGCFWSSTMSKPYYLDGALAGHATTVSAELQPDALMFLVPPPR